MRSSYYENRTENEKGTLGTRAQNPSGTVYQKQQTRIEGPRRHRVRRHHRRSESGIEGIGMFDPSRGRMVSALFPGMNAGATIIQALPGLFVCVKFGLW